MVEWLRFALYFSLVWHVFLGFHLSRSFYPQPNLIFYSKNRHIKPKSVNVVRLIFITSITCYFYFNLAHTHIRIRKRVGKKSTYKHTCDQSRLRALFSTTVFKYKKTEENNHNTNIHDGMYVIKWYADKLQPTHILSIFDSIFTLAAHTHTLTLCSLDKSFRFIFRLTFLTMVSAACACMCTVHKSLEIDRIAHTVYGFWFLDVMSNHGNAL